MRGIAYKDSVLFALLLSVLVSAGMLFVGYYTIGPGTIPSAQAQTEMVVFLQHPLSGSVVRGQTLFDVYFSNYDGTLIDIVELELLSGEMNSTSYGLINILESSVDPPWLWHLIGDTMDFENGNYRIRIHAYELVGNVSVELNLVNMEGGEPIFPLERYEPITFYNDYMVVYPANNAEVSGTIELLASLPGEVNSVAFSISSFDFPSQNFSVTAERQGIYPPGERVHWAADLDTTVMQDTEYEMVMNVQTLGGTELSNVARTTFLVMNNYCTLQWECSTWEPCSDGNTVCTEYYDPNDPDCLTTDPPPAQTCTEPLPPPCTLTWECTNSVPCEDGSIYCTEYDDPNDPNCLTTDPPPVQTCTESLSCTLDWECTEWLPCDDGVSICPEYYDPNDPDCLNISSRLATQSACDAPAFVKPVIVMVAPEDRQRYTTRYIPLEARVDEGSVDRLSFHFVRENNIPHLIGEAQVFPTDPLSWALNWDTLEVPNGWYRIYARGYVTIDGERQHFRSEGSIVIAIIHEGDDQQEVSSEPPVENECDDSDGDGVCDVVEERIGTNPNVVDTTPDEAEAKLELMQEITVDEKQEYKQQIESFKFEQPTTHGTLAPEKLTVEAVENFSPLIGRNQLVFKGKGPPNSIVTLFIYSTPLVVETTTDEFGNYSYTLTQNMVDGEHEVYVTITDDTGKIVEKSEATTFFVRRAQAVTREEYLRGDVNVKTESESVISSYLIVTLSIVGAALIFLLGFYVIGKRRRSIV